MPWCESYFFVNLLFLFIFVWEVALQKNFTNHYAIKTIPYRIVFNCKQRFERFDIANRHLTKLDIEEYVIDDYQEDFLDAEDREG